MKKLRFRKIISCAIMGIGGVIICMLLIPTCILLVTIYIFYQLTDKLIGLVDGGGTWAMKR